MLHEKKKHRMCTKHANFTPNNNINTIAEFSSNATEIDDISNDV